MKEEKKNKKIRKFFELAILLLVAGGIIVFSYVNGSIIEAFFIPLGVISYLLNEWGKEDE